ncbi:TIGR03087 family PEP-CTERM/XrtA system glycosyltransferase [Alteromonas sp. ASW11-19]|uniref:TIGR03087 family PEP-CTERM/XrtA system glycosyltransferase n=1 Tax=Alteromonas salexigens TaxID=2982530 RepID=A0ABT2VQM6_9ALTE|nr:TIGR03087 family PEP-CTERM/XrtA system glycosyltransferase [Alteromonas salexigens]MCU7555622.1 TIGR03087 family PEP-CTERM/XrtA system glycosyltransferase [Alteromonas salexigens]
MNTALNILYIAHRVPFPPNKGEKIRTFHQLEHLTNQGHNLTILFPADSEEDTRLGEELAVHLKCDVSSVRLPAKPVRLGKALVRREPLSVGNFYAPEMQTMIDGLFDQTVFDAIVFTASSVAKYAFNSRHDLSSFPNTQLVMDFMDLDSDKWQQYARQAGWPMRWVYTREARVLSDYEKRINEAFNASVFVAEAEADLFRQRTGNPERVHAIENGVDTKAYRPSETAADQPAPAFLFTGVMDYKPNVDAVLWFTEHVWPKLLERYPTATFVICGMNPTPEISALASTPGIRVTGFVDEILPFYHEASVFVAPFRLARGIQNKILQAFACGLPVVTTTKGLEGLDATPGEHLLVADEADAFFAHILHLLEEPVRFNAVRQAALNKVLQRYSWNGVLTKFNSLLTGEA